MTAVVPRSADRVVFRLAAGRAVRSGAVWGVVFAAYVLVQLAAYSSTYPTAASRSGLEVAYGHNKALNAIFGRAHDIRTVNGYAEWRLLGLLSVIAALWGLLTATKLLRGEEDAGRTELLLAGPTTRRAAAVQTALGLLAGLTALFACTAAGALIAGRSTTDGFGPGAALLLALAIAGSAAVFLAIGLLCSQLLGSRRRAAALAGAVFAAAYALRMAADAGTGLSALRWCTPLGWPELVAPLTHRDAWALPPTAALIAVATTLALVLAARRDVGAGVLPDVGRRRSRLRLLGGATGLAIRTSRAAAAGWLGAVAGLSLLIGSLAQGSTRDATGSRDIRRALGRLGGHGQLVDVYLGLMMLLAAVVVGFMAAGHVVAMRAEEAEGRLDHLLARPLTRLRWLGGRLAVAGTAVIVGGLLAGVCAWLGAHGGVGIGTMVQAGLNVVPPALLVLGIGVLAFGLLPRRASAVVHGYLVWSALIEFLGGSVEVDHRLLDTSVLFHVTPAPATAPDRTSGAVIVALAVAAALVGAFAFSRRDLQPTT